MRFTTCCGQHRWIPATSMSKPGPRRRIRHLLHYSARTSPCPKYRAADESVVAEVDKTLTHCTTDEGLVAPGATALFRVYVVLTTANEKGSNTASVTRPEV